METYEYQGVVHIAVTFDMPKWGMLCAMVPLTDELVRAGAPTCLLCIGLSEALSRAGDIFFEEFRKTLP